MLRTLRRGTVRGACEEESMGEIINRVMRAEVTLLPREDGRPQRPPCLFTGYRCSTLRFDYPRRERPAGYFSLAVMRLRDRDEVPVGEVAEVYMQVALAAALADDLRPGAQFSLYEGGRRVVRGTILSLLDPADPADPASDTRLPE
jgi:hypothetical protein